VRAVLIDVGELPHGRGRQPELARRLGLRGVGADAGNLADAVDVELVRLEDDSKHDGDAGPLDRLPADDLADEAVVLLDGGSSGEVLLKTRVDLGGGEGLDERDLVFEANVEVGDASDDVAGCREPLVRLGGVVAAVRVDDRTDQDAGLGYLHRGTVHREGGGDVDGDPLVVGPRNDLRRVDPLVREPVEEDGLFDGAAHLHDGVHGSVGIVQVACGDAVGDDPVLAVHPDGHQQSDVVDGEGAPLPLAVGGEDLGTKPGVDAKPPSRILVEGLPGDKDVVRDARVLAQLEREVDQEPVEAFPAIQHQPADRR
jgi:hypothetical protein